MAYKLIQRAQKRHNLVEKPLKMADFLQYLLWRPYAKIYQIDTRNLQVLSHTYLHTDQGAQKRHNLEEKPLKMADFLQYLLWRPYSKIYQKDHTQTGYISR